MEPIHEKKRSKKSRWTVPLIKAIQIDPLGKYLQVSEVASAASRIHIFGNLWTLLGVLYCIVLYYDIAGLYGTLLVGNFKTNSISFSILTMNQILKEF